MVEKVAAVAALVALLAIALVPNCISMTRKISYQPSGAVIICGWNEGPDITDFWVDSYFAYWMMRNYYNLSSDQVAYLAPMMTPDIDFPPNAITGLSTKENVQYYLGQWLRQYRNDVFVYVASHGGGWNNATQLLEGGRNDTSGDEGNEYYVNGSWINVDEGIYLKNGNTMYWDDEMRENLSWTLSSPVCYSTIMLQNCYNEEYSNLTCFSGGFIDDLSSMYARTILTSSNETGLSYGRCEWDTRSNPFSPFTYRFFTSILGYEVDWDGLNGIAIDYLHPIDWSYKSLRGAYEYVLQHDGAHLAGKEFPWIDDDGDRLPNFENNNETLDFPCNATTELMRWLQCDVNYDGKVNMMDIAIVAVAFRATPSSAKWNKQADIRGEDWKIDMRDIASVANSFGKTT